MRNITKIWLVFACVIAASSNCQVAKYEKVDGLSVSCSIAAHCVRIEHAIQSCAPYTQSCERFTRIIDCRDAQAHAIKSFDSVKDCINFVSTR